ncbi:MAG: hypothetical protein WAU70_05625 [Flavobacteriales bacterium]
MILLAFTTNAQNLVPNGSFETYTTLPNGYAQLCKATGWTSTSGACTLVPGCGHPDFMHTAGSGGVQAPNTTFGTTMPHTGNGMIGFTDWYLVGVTNFREYPRIALTSALVPGQAYTVSFWTTNGTNPYSGWGANNLGVAFTMAPVNQACSTPLTGITPQIEIPTIVHSTTWQLHSFTFTPAQPFQYMCIGNFHTDAGTTAAQMSATGGVGAYYFLDDVSVVPAVVLPIELIDFNAECENDAVLLNWSTATETENDHFTVERSADGDIWEAIGTVSGAGNSQQVVEYIFRDPGSTSSVGYYRLGQTEFDGSLTYSHVVARPSCVDKEMVRQVLIDASGRTCGAWPTARGVLSTGIYLVRTEFSDGSSTTKKVYVIPQ